MLNVKSLKTAFALLMSVIVIGIVAVVVVQYLGKRDLLVNGPKYKEIVADKDLVADILPPPAYVLESYLLALQMRGGSSTRINELAARFEKAQSEFDTRHKVWQAEELVPPAIKLVMKDAQDAGNTFYLIAARDYIPAVKAGDAKAIDSALGLMDQAYESHREKIDKAVELAIAKQSQDEQSAADGLEASTRWMAVVGTLVLALAMWVAYRVLGSIRRMIGGEPAVAGDILGEVAAGNLQSTISVVPGDKTSLMASLQTMQTQLLERAENDKRVADEMLRIKIGLDNVSTGVMIADAGRKIIYINHAVQRILKEAEADIKKVLPTFNADKLVGESIDQFHKNPAHQAKMLGELTRSHIAPLTIGGRNLVVTASPVINEQGERLGAVAEWMDRTAEVQLEQEVENLIVAAGKGDFAARLELEGKTGFFRKLAEGLNQLSATTSAGLSDVSNVLQAVAQGDLTRTIDAQYSGQFGDLKDNTNTTIERLREVVGRIKEATDLINTAAKEIAAGNTDLSSRTEEQASSLEETASSMEELNSTVKQNAENASQANTLARSSNETAVKSGQVVQQIVSTMTGISESSKKIADIIGVIDSIAFQTNILALNAAVEAARAGEQGRGFAVVATEVRNLAQRSATAAKEIKELIAESTGKVDTGTKLVDQAGVSMDAVVTSFNQVTALVTDIANASKEQSSGIEQVTQAVGQMDEVTQQNAALVEQAAAAAESLEEQAHALAQAVAMFKLDEGSAASSRNIPGPALRNAPSPRQLMARPASPGSSGGRKLSPPQANDTGDEWEEF